MATRSEILKVPGARLYYEVQGSGPVLAERLGAAAVTFPGDHGGYNGQPAGFAGRLHQVPNASEKGENNGHRK